MTETFSLSSNKKLIRIKLVALYLFVSPTRGYCAEDGPWRDFEWNYTDPKDPNRNYRIENGIAYFADFNRIESAKMIFNGSFVDIYAFENVQLIQTFLS